MDPLRMFAVYAGPLLTGCALGLLGALVEDLTPLNSIAHALYCCAWAVGFAQLPAWIGSGESQGLKNWMRGEEPPGDGPPCS